MKNLIRCFACAMALAACLCAFTACSDHTTYNCEAYDFVAADGSVMNMLNMLNGLTLTLNKDGTCSLVVATPAGVESYGGTWKDQDGYIVTAINADWSMNLKKDGKTLTHTGAEVINGKTGVSTVRFVKA